MRLLLDTHAVIWWFTGDDSLSETARAAIDSDQNEVWISAVSAFEIATKHRLGKLPEAEQIVHRLVDLVQEHDLRVLDLSMAQAQHAGRLKIALRDPFDRMLIAQSLLEQMSLVSTERLFDDFGVSRLW